MERGSDPKICDPTDQNMDHVLKNSAMNLNPVNLNGSGYGSKIIRSKSDPLTRS